MDIGSVVGTGPFGRITAADVEAKAGIAPSKSTISAASAPASSTAAAPPPPKASSGSLPPPVPGSTVVPFTTMQAAVSKNMAESLSVPTFRVCYPVTTDALDALYEKRYGEINKQRLDRAIVTFLQNFKKSYIGDQAMHSSIKLFDQLSKLVGLHDHLKVSNAVVGKIATNLKSYTQWKELVEKARSKQLQPHEYNSGRFTLSNLGMFGVDRFNTILPPGQGAIMVVGASKPTVVADADGFFSVKSKMLLSLDRSSALSKHDGGDASASKWRRSERRPRC